MFQEKAFFYETWGLAESVAQLAMVAATIQIYLNQNFKDVRIEYAQLVTIGSLCVCVHCVLEWIRWSLEIWELNCFS